MYILKISPKAFVKQGQDGEIIIVSNSDRATLFEKMGDAMRVAVQLNEDLDIDLVKVISI